MSFDPLARHYRWLEWVIAGEKLQRGRLYHLGHLDSGARPGGSLRVLLLGEGNGRFLTELARRHPSARMDCLDLSARMLERARAHLKRRGGLGSNVRFIQANVLEPLPALGPYDVVATHFFLDCFTEPQLRLITSKISGLAASRCRWFLADFRCPERGWKRLRSQLILRIMYSFFRRAVHLGAAGLVNPDPLLRQHGFSLKERAITEWGLLHTDLWERGTSVSNQTPPAACPGEESGEPRLR